MTKGKIVRIIEFGDSLDNRIARVLYPGGENSWWVQFLDDGDQNNIEEKWLEEASPLEAIAGVAE